MSEREEMRKLIDVIERGAMSASVQQNIEDMRLFANTASFIANKLDTKLKQKKAKPKLRQVAPSVPKLPVPKPTVAQNKPKPTTTTNEPAMPAARGTATSSTDFQRLRSVQPQPPVSSTVPVNTAN
jgi:hypothetical protein